MIFRFIPASCILNCAETNYEKVPGDRTRVNMKINAVSARESHLALEAYPMDAVGYRLMFGAR